MRQYLVILGVTIQFFGIIIYIKKIIKGEGKPNKVTWLMRSIAPLIATIAALSDGVRRAVLPIFMSGFGPLLIFITALFHPQAYWKIEKFDYICGILSLFALIGRAITKEAWVAVSFAVLSDLSAGIPTLIKSRKHPETESYETFLAGLISILTSFFAMQSYSITETSFAVYIVIFNTTIITILLRKRIANLWSNSKFRT